MKFRIRFDLRTLALVALMAVSLLAVAGCGDDDAPSGTDDQAADVSGSTGAGDEASLKEKAAKGKLTKEEAKALEEENFSEEPPPIQILTGAETGYHVSEPTVVVVQSKSELSSLKKKHFSRGVKRQSVVPVGLGERQIVAVYLPQDKGGALVAINDIHEEDGKILVSAVRLLPGEGCTDLGPKVRPFHWVETRAMEGDAKLVVKTQKSSPCG